MRKIKKILFIWCMGLMMSLPNYAGILNTPIAVPNKLSNERPDYRWMTSSYVGYAWSGLAGIANPNPKQFNAVKPGDTDDGNFGNVAYAGFSLSRKFSKYYLLSFSYDVYGAFVYRRYHQTATAPERQAGVEILGIPYSRSFSLDHQGALFNLILDLPKKFEYVYKEMHLKPACSGGIGMGISKVKNFQSLGFTDIVPYSQITTISPTSTTINFAWQCTVGLGMRPRNSAVSFGVAYRYYNGGRFASSNIFILNDDENMGQPVQLTAWSGKLRTQQLKMYINAEF